MNDFEHKGKGILIACITGSSKPMNQKTKRGILSVNFQEQDLRLPSQKINRMKLFKIFAGIMGLFAMFFIVALFFPHAYRIERNTVVNLPVSTTYGYLNNIRNWKDWSPWNEDLDSTMVSFYSVNPVGSGATQYFRGDLVGIGRFRITESNPNERIRYHLSINDGTMQSSATFQFRPVGGKTELIWVDEGDVGYNPLFRYLLPSKIKDTEKAFEEGLVAIKKAAETHAGNP